MCFYRATHQSIQPPEIQAKEEEEECHFAWSIMDSSQPDVSTKLSIFSFLN